jgi:hypothetical protein
MRDTLLDGTDAMRGQLQPSPHRLTAPKGSRRTVATLPPRDKRRWRFHTRLPIGQLAGGGAAALQDLRFDRALIHEQIAGYMK